MSICGKDLFKKLFRYQFSCITVFWQQIKYTNRETNYIDCGTAQTVSCELNVRDDPSCLYAYKKYHLYTLYLLWHSSLVPLQDSLAWQVLTKSPLACSYPVLHVYVALVPLSYLAWSGSTLAFGTVTLAHCLTTKGSNVRKHRQKL